MKKILLVLGGLGITGSAQAQLGVKAGTNYSQLTATSRSQSQTFSSDGKVGYQLGAFYERKITKRVALVPEVQFIQQQANVKIQDFEEGYKTDYQVRLSSVSVPVALRAYFGRFYLDFGSQVSTLLSAREKGAFDTRLSFEVVPNHNDISYFNQSALGGYQRFTFASFVGLGLRLPAGLAGNVRLTSSWDDINRENQPNRYAGSLGNVTVQTSLSYQLAAKR